MVRLIRYIAILNCAEYGDIIQEQLLFKKNQPNYAILIFSEGPTVFFPHFNYT